MRPNILTIALLAGLTVPAALLAQAEESPARQASRRAQQLLASGDWQQAAEVANKALTDCEPGKPGRECRLRLYYTLGYIHQVQSRMQPGDATKLLDIAADYYERVLAEQPDHSPSLKNLALIYSALGDKGGREGTEAFLKSAIAKDTVNTATYALLLGDRYRSDGAWRSALEAYDRAALENPEDESARLQIVEVHRYLPAAESKNLFEQLPEWESRFPGAARRGYEVIMGQTYRSDPMLAERALIKWADLLARRRSIDLKSLETLPSEWRDDAVTGLRDYLEQPYRRPESSNFWMQNSERRNTLAAVGLALGVRKVAEGDVTRAEACWNTGLEFAPIDGVTLLDLRVELASLYNRYPQLDPEGEKFDRIEYELFEEKGAAYSEDDLDAIQQYHAVLALIYSEKGVWTSSGYARNAIFQLEHAIGTAIQRDALEGTYQPLAYLKSKLAEGYATTGNASEARRMYVEAAAAYLDSDDPQNAVQSWNLAAELGEKGDRLKSLVGLIYLRGQAERLRAKAPGADTVCHAPERLARAFQTAARSDLGPQFLARQRFKLLSDCAGLVEGGLRAQYAAEAMELAAGGNLALVGAGDLNRLERVQRQVRQLVGLRSLETGIQFNERGDAAHSLSLALPGSAAPAYVTVEPTTVLAGRVVGVLRPEQPGLRLDIRPDGAISVLETSAAYSDAELTASLERVKGVREVKLSNPKVQRIDKKPPP